MPILLAIILVWFIVKFQKRKNQHEIEIRDAKILKQQILLKQQQALESERNRIAGEMHDDLGGGLTTIKFLSEKVLRKITNPTQKKQIQKIVSHAQNLVSNMSEIIWAMNDRFNTLGNLIAYTRRYVYDYIEDYEELTLEFNVKGHLDHYEFTGEQRRHLFLIIKEAIHNIVKHAQATLVEIKFDINEQLHISIKDNGIGLNEQNITNGNGIRNIKIRVKKLNGYIEFKDDDGLIIEIKLPLK